MAAAMEFTFLGTGDASGFPHPFGNRESDEEARELGGPSFRLRSHAIINDELLIDLGPDLLVSSYLRKKSFHGVRYVLQTHPHMDHLEPAQLAMRSERFGIEGLPHLTFAGTRASTDRVRNLLRDHKSLKGRPEAELLDLLKVTLVDIEAHQSFELGPYQVTAVPASHDEPGICVLYAITLGDRSFFYGTDTGPIDDSAWVTLRDRGITFDAVALDQTMGTNAGNAGHMSGAMVRETIEQMRAYGLLKEHARIFATHIAPHSNPSHPKLVEIAAASGYEVAYDGLTIDVGEVELSVAAESSATMGARGVPA